MLVTHYTDDNPFELHTITIKNEGWGKPIGGLWASPLHSQYGWKDWCGEENYMRREYEIVMELDMTNVLRIDTIEHLNNLEWYKPSTNHDSFMFIDYESLKQGEIDGIYLSLEGLHALRRTQVKFDRDVLAKTQNFWGWDCESICIINERCVKSYEPTLALLDKTR